MLKKLKIRETQIEIAAPTLAQPEPALNLKGGRLKRLELLWLTNKEAFLIWLGWRVVFIFFPVFAGLLFPHATGVGLPGPNPNAGLERWFGGWMHWDGGWYVEVAARGYQGDNTAAFYPLYLLLLRGLAFVFTLGNISDDALNITGVILSSLAALTTCLLLYQLACQDYDQETARLSVLYLMAFPTAFFLFAVYTEALFMALAIGAFYAARKNRWLIALLLAALAVLTKNQGLLLVAALLVEYVVQQRPCRFRPDYRIFFFGLPLLTFGGWLLFNQLTFGNPLQFLSANQQYWGHYFAWPWQVLAKAAADFKRILNSTVGPGTELMQQDYLNLVSFPLTIGFVGLAFAGGWAVWRGRLRLAYLVFFLGCLLQPLVSPVAEQPLLSMPRYLLVIFPAFFLLALAGRNWRIIHYSYLAFSLPLLGLLLARFVLWYWAS